MNGAIVGPIEGRQQHQGCCVAVGQWQWWRWQCGNGNTTINLKRTAASNCINKGGIGGGDQWKSIVVSSLIVGACQWEMEDCMQSTTSPKKDGR